MELRTLLKELSGLMSITGYTHKSTDKLKALVGEYFDEYYGDSVGNHVFVRRCGKENAPKILIDTHYDEIGMMATNIHKGGFVSMTNVGGLDMRIMQAAEVTIYGEDENGAEKEIYGVVVSTPPHLTKPSEARKLKEISELYIDTGYSEDELRKYVRLGTPIGFRGIYRDLLGNKISGKSFDCKACGACAVYAIANTPREELAGDVYMLFSNFEETGIHFGGAVTAGFSIDPDYALVADVNGAAVPGDTRRRPKMGEGPSITIAPITNRKLTKMFIAECDEKGIKLQCEAAAGRTGTNTTALNLVGAGIPLVDIGLPLKNMHTYNEVISVVDAEKTADAMKVFITSENIAKEFKR